MGCVASADKVEPLGPQLRAQGEDTTAPRKISGTVPISQLGNMMRSLGFYPSTREVDAEAPPVVSTSVSSRSLRTAWSLDEDAIVARKELVHLGDVHGCRPAFESV